MSTDPRADVGFNVSLTGTIRPFKAFAVFTSSGSGTNRNESTRCMTFAA